MVKRCAACQHHQVSNPKETIIQEEALRPWEVLSTDLFFWNNSNYLLLVDHYSSYFVIDPFPGRDLQAQDHLLRIWHTAQSNKRQRPTIRSSRLQELQHKIRV